MVVTRTDIGQRLLELGVNSGTLVAVPEKFKPEESLGLQRKRFRSSSFAKNILGVFRILQSCFQMMTRKGRMKR